MLGDVKENIIDNVSIYVEEKLTSEELKNFRFFMNMKLENYNITKKPNSYFSSSVNRTESVLEKYKKYLEVMGRSSKTIEAYLLELRVVFRNIIKPIEEITTEDILEYFENCKINNHVGNRYINNKRIILSVFYDWMIKKGYALYNPVKNIDPIKYEKKIKIPYTDEEREKIKCSCDHERDIAIIEFLYSTGMRVGELVRLNISDIDTVNRECVVYGKGAKERHTYFNEVANYHIKKYLSQRTDDNPALFISIRKPYTRMTEHSVRSTLKRIEAKSGVKNVHPHRYRRTTATNALNRGMPVQEVQALLGHSDINTTMMYGTVANKNVKNSHEKFLSS